MVSGILIVVCIILGFFAVHKMANKDKDLIIVLSPHYDDAVLSLGGMLAKKDHPAIVVTFFTAAPSVATTTRWDMGSGFSSSDETMVERKKENDSALKILGAKGMDLGYEDNEYRRSSGSDVTEQDLAKDIQAVIAANVDKNIFIYGPAIFSSGISHPDHALVHDAYLDVEKDFPSDNVTFYIYEDFPYAEKFESSSNISLLKYIEKDSGLLLERLSIPISFGEQNTQVRAIEAYASQVKAFRSFGRDIIDSLQKFERTRCENGCEDVYKIFKIQ